MFPLLGNGGLTNTTNQTYLRQGQVGELANQYMVEQDQRLREVLRQPNICRAPTW